jgi:anionic cell wall polymer biosynthesis LytR-Cps2A-Psr (LCP) family protein
MTNVHLDHVAAIDFGGFKDVTNALGGVDLTVDQSITSIHWPHRRFTKGVMHMNGDQALDWIRQRKQFPQGDFARMRHQQEFLKALMDKAASTGTLSNPVKLNNFLNAVTAAVTVDKDFSLTDMAVQFRNLRSSNLKFFTSPNRGSQMIAGQSVVVSDRTKALALYQAMTADKMSEWMAANRTG